MRITLGPKNLWQCSTQPPFTTQTREIEGRKASLPMEQVSQSGHLAQQMLDEHANLYGQILSQCQYFLVSKSIYFPWQNAHTATITPTSTHLSWAQIPGCTRELADSSCPVITREGHLLIRGIQEEWEGRLKECGAWRGKARAWVS